MDNKLYLWIKKDFLIMWFKNILHLRIFMILATMFLPVKLLHNTQYTEAINQKQKDIT